MKDVNEGAASLLRAMAAMSDALEAFALSLAPDDAPPEDAPAEGEKPRTHKAGAE